MNHLQVYQMERYIPVSESNWIMWANRAEKLLGHSLDGDQTKDGYSLDSAYDAFKSGLMPNQYINSIKK